MENLLCMMDDETRQEIRLIPLFSSDSESQLAKRDAMASISLLIPTLSPILGGELRVIKGDHVPKVKFGFIAIKYLRNKNFPPDFLLRFTNPNNGKGKQEISMSSFLGKYFFNNMLLVRFFHL
jgi:hypothetical protein